VLFRTATEWVALLGEAQRRDRLDEELDRLDCRHGVAEDLTPGGERLVEVTIRLRRS
jgi:hypothetical protein